MFEGGRALVVSMFKGRQAQVASILPSNRDKCRKGHPMFWNQEPTESDRPICETKYPLSRIKNGESKQSSITSMHVYG